MVQPGARSRIVLSIIWLLLGAAMIAVAVWLGWTSWSVLLSGHPALLLLTIACAVVGLVAVLWAGGSLILGGRLDREWDSVTPRRRTPAQMKQRARLRLILAIPALVLATLLVAVVAYARPLAATPVALAALVPNDQVRIADRITWYEMSPIREDRAGNAILPTTGLVFVPGARVDSRAYAHVLLPLVEDGYFVAVLKEPLGFSILDPDHPESVLAVHPEITYWALGGHSLGGTTAAATADAHEQVNGLVLFALLPGQPDRAHRPEGHLGVRQRGRPGCSGRDRAVQGGSARGHRVRRGAGRRPQLVRGLRRAARRQPRVGRPGRSSGLDGRGRPCACSSPWPRRAKK